MMYKWRPATAWGIFYRTISSHISTANAKTTGVQAKKEYISNDNRKQKMTWGIWEDSIHPR